MQYRIQYLRDTKGQPQGCLAIKADFNSNFATYQVSVLNPKDKFDRHLARKIAIGRLETSPRKIMQPISGNMHEITSRIMTNIYCDKSLPTRARKAAELWLDNADHLPASV